MRHALDADAGDGGAAERGEQDAAKAVAERVAKALVERLDRESATTVVDFLGGDAGDLEISGHEFLALRVLKLGVSGLLGVQLDDQLLLYRRRDLAALGQAQDFGGEGIVICLQPGRNRRDEFGGPADRVGSGRSGLD